MPRTAIQQQAAGWSFFGPRAGTGEFWAENKSGGANLVQAAKTMALLRQSIDDYVSWRTARGETYEQ